MRCAFNAINMFSMIRAFSIGLGLLLCSVELFSQNTTIAFADSSQMVYNAGIELGAPAMYAHTPAQSPNYWLNGTPVLSSNLALSLQISRERSRGLGYGLSLAYRRYQAEMDSDRQQNWFSSSTVIGHTASLHHLVFSPQVNYLIPLSAVLELSPYAAVHTHLSLGGSEPTQYTLGSFSYRQKSFFAFPALGLRIYKQVLPTWALGFFVEASAGLYPFTSLRFKPALSQTEYNLGHFRGSGFNFGVSFNYRVSGK
jgi:hypothetical protein